MNARQIENSMKEPCTLLKNILKRVALNKWVDIENEYYALLIKQTYPMISNSQKPDQKF